MIVPSGTVGTQCTVNVGTTTTLPPNTNATVTNSGTSISAILNFGIPTGATGPQGEQGEQGPRGERGPAGESTFEAMLAAAAAAASATAASTSATASAAAAVQSAEYAAAAEAAAASINGEFNGRITTLETKTQFQNSFTDMNLDSNTDFDGILNIKTNSGSNGVVIDGNTKKIFVGNTTIENNIITSATVYTNTIDAGDSFSDLNIGKYSGLNINIGNPILASSAITRNVINLYGKVNFSNDDIVGNFFQF
jgi:hypothetical protein